MEDSVEVILRESVENLGKRGDVVQVANGYARNYLLPKKIALKVSPSNIRQIEQEKRKLEARQVKALGAARDLAQALEGLSITIVRKVAEDEELYGSVQVSDIAQQLEAAGFQIARSSILLTEPIRQLGIYQIPVKLHTDVIAEIKVWVVRE